MPPCIIDIAINTSGQMYRFRHCSDSLISINPATGAGTVIGPAGFDGNYAQGMDFDDLTGILYLAAIIRPWAEVNSEPQISRQQHNAGRTVSGQCSGRLSCDRFIRRTAAREHGAGGIDVGVSGDVLSWTYTDADSDPSGIL